jgi:phospholipid transport system substrate-binding protein
MSMKTTIPAARILSAIVALVTVLTSFTASSLAASCPGANIVRNAGSALIDAAHSGAAPGFASVLTRYADVKGIAMFALGEYRSALPAGRQSEYLAYTQRYITKFLVDNSGSFRNSSNLAIETCNGSLVGSSLDGRSKVIWRLSGGRIEDVSLDGVWLALELRSKFTDIIRRNHGDVSALLDFLSA